MNYFILAQCRPIGAYIGLLSEINSLLYYFQSRKYDSICTFLLAAFCSLASPWQGLGVGAVGGLVAIGGDELLRRLKIDDPVGEFQNYYWGDST